MIGSRAFLASLLCGLALQPIFIRSLRRGGVMDVPNRRSSHVRATPRGGGVAVLAALGVGIVVGGSGGSNVWLIVLGALVLGAVGLWDDIQGGLSPKVRLGWLVIVGASAGALLVAPVPLMLAVPAMAVWTTCYVNAFNFMDGINGISGLSALVAGVTYSGIGLQIGSSAATLLGAALAGASASFLPYNLPRARVFLGDVGSYSLGFVIASLAWLVWSAGTPLALALAPTAVYLIDTGTTLLRRYHQGRPLTEAHREHTYQRLTVDGRSHVAVALFVVGVQAFVTVIVWLALRTQHEGLGLTVVLVTLLGYVMSPLAFSPRERPA